MDKNGDDSRWEELPTDALVEILARLPRNVRLRFRHVCQHWRELMDQRTATDIRRRTKIIAVPEKCSASAVVVDLLKPLPGSKTNLWQGTDADTALGYSHMSMVGTCNGLVCLCDDDVPPGGAITVANPSTGETLRLPPLQVSSAAAHLNNNISRNWHHKTYSFAYHETTTTGPRYKVVHVPCEFDRFWQPETVHVFTLGEASWRDVQAETNARCSLGGTSSLADVDGTVYWITEDGASIMSLDVRHERFMGTKPLPAPVTAMPSTRCLTKVHGRLGVAVGDGVYDSVLTVWVLESERWSRRYVLEVQGPWRQEPWMRRPTRELVGPDLVRGDYLLTLTHEAPIRPSALYRHTLSEAAMSQDGVVHIAHRDEAELLVRLGRCAHRTFVYVETDEPLSVYNAGLVHN